MVKQNPIFSLISPTYLFPEINRRKREFIEKNPQATLISLGIGDTTEPVTPTINQSLVNKSIQLGSIEGYTGYGPEQGILELRELISKRVYEGCVSPNDIFISDGAKCDIGRLQFLLNPDHEVAIQDPSYPVYVDASIMSGAKSLKLLPCLPENNFFPDLSPIAPSSIIYWCSPNNPTGTVSTRKQLESLVQFAISNNCLIIFDAAYSLFIQDRRLPRSIFEIPGADKVAIELNSFSKSAGFTGIRLGWSVVPEALCYENGKSIQSDWKRIVSTLFNGASIISQHGGIAALEDEGFKEMHKLIEIYLENTHILSDALKRQGHTIYGGEHIPYIWLKTQHDNSWNAFQYYLERFHLVTTPGSGFGKSGEKFLRISGFGRREQILEASRRILS